MLINPLINVNFCVMKNKRFAIIERWSKCKENYIDIICNFEKISNIVFNFSCIWECFFENFSRKSEDFTDKKDIYLNNSCYKKKNLLTVRN